MSRAGTVIALGALALVVAVVALASTQRSALLEVAPQQALYEYHVPGDYLGGDGGMDSDYDDAIAPSEVRISVATFYTLMFCLSAPMTRRAPAVLRFGSEGRCALRWAWFRCRRSQSHLPGMIPTYIVYEPALHLK